MYNHHKTISAFFLVLFIFPAAVLSQAAAPAPSIERSRFTQARQDAFDLVWTTVYEKHFDTTFGGVDWKAMREKYLPLAAKANSDEEFHAVLGRMLGELRLSHFYVFPAPPDPADNTEHGGETGISLIWLNDLPVVLRIREGSVADKAGIRPGDIVENIDGKSISELTGPLAAGFDQRKLSPGIRRVYLERFLESLMSGKPGSEVSIGIVKGGGAKARLRLLRETVEREMSQAIGGFPKQKVEFESRLLSGGVGYIRFNMWIVPQMEKLRTAIHSFSNARGLIFDLRGNPGGLGSMASGIAGLISDKQISLGTMTSRTGTTSLIGYPQKEPFAGKVVVLIDHGSASTSEMFAAGLKENGRATLVGERTAGAILLSLFQPLPTGWVFQYAISDYRSPNNILIEGVGVKPDVEVFLTRQSLLQGRDIQLEAAIGNILEDKH